jgi:hypothetical protein
MVWTELIRVGSVAGFCEHDNDPSVFMTGGELLDHLRNYQRLKKDFALHSLLILLRKMDCTENHLVSLVTNGNAQTWHRCICVHRLSHTDLT